MNTNTNTTEAPAVRQTIDRNEAIKLIRAALKERSGRMWSVTGGSGTAWGWIRIEATPARRTWASRLKAGCTEHTPENYEQYDSGEKGRDMSPADCAELAALLGLDRGVSRSGGVSIPASSEHYREYVDRAEGRTPLVIGKQYWD